MRGETTHSHPLSYIQVIDMASTFRFFFFFFDCHDFLMAPD